MKKSIFTLGSISVVCACGLVIDPDKLVEGNATPVGNIEGGPDTSSGGPDGSGTDTGATDAGQDGNPIVEVPECVPALPNTPGVKGPYAVVTANKGAPIACPPGYLAAPVDQGDGQLSAPPASCNSSAGCACGTATGTAKCGLRLRYYDDNQCTGPEADDPTTLGAFNPCPPIDDEDYVKLETTVNGISCTPSGSTTPSAKPAPTFGTTTIICAPDPNVKTAQCKGDDIPLPVAKAAQACIIVPMNESCSGGDYGSARFLSKTGAVTDNRGCTCECSGDPSTSCTGGSVKTWPGFLCSGGTSASLAAGTCRARGPNDDVMNLESAPIASGTPSCTTRAAPSGEAVPTWDVKLCCLGSGGGGD